MSSAVKVILGVSVLAMAAGFAACDGGTPTPPLAVAGSSNSSAGTGTTPQGGSNAAGGSSGAGPSLPGIPLDPAAGWVPDTNAAKIQGALFSFGDPTSKMGLMEDFTGSKACIKGNAAKVDTSSAICKSGMFTPPAMDCYGEYWGVAIGLNLNQAIDPVSMKGAMEQPYDATNLEGFGFDVEGATIPGGTDFRFKVEDGTKEYCTPKAVKVKKGFQIIKFSDLMAECWQTTDPPNATVTPAVQSHLIKISWQVVTNTGGVVPFDFCVSDIRAIPKAGTTGAPPGSTSSGGAPGAGGSAATGGSGGTASGGTSAGGSSAGGTSAGGTSAGGTSAGGTSAGGSSAGSGGAKAGSGGTAG